MPFSGFNLATTLLIGGVTAAAIALLHWLKPNPIQRRIVSTIFWRAAQAKMRPRFLWQRLRGPLSILLIALPCLALVLAVCEPVLMAGTKSTPQLIVLETDFRTQAKDTDNEQTRLESAKQAASEFVVTLDPRTPCSVITVDRSPSVIHAADAPRALLTQHIAGITAASAPLDRAQTLAWIEQWLREQATPITVRWYSTDPAAVKALLANAENASEFTVLPAGEADGNGAILWADFITPTSWAASGKLQVRIAWWGSEVANLNLATTTESTTQPQSTSIQLSPGAEQTLELGPFAADGSTIKLELSEPAGTPADNRVSVQLPNRPQLRATITSAIPPALELALQASGVDVQAATGDATFWVTADDNLAANPTGPGIVIVNTGPAIESPQSLTTGNTTWDNAKTGVGTALGLDPTAEGITPLLQAGPYLLAAFDRRNTDSPRLLLANALLTPEASLLNSAEFPAFIAAAVRKLCDVEAVAPVVSLRRELSDPLWTSSVLTDRHATAITGDRSTSAVTMTNQTAESATSATPARQYLPASWLLLGALLLIAVEGTAQARRWIP